MTNIFLIIYLTWMVYNIVISIINTVLFVITRVKERAYIRKLVNLRQNVYKNPYTEKESYYLGNKLNSWEEEFIDNYYKDELINTIGDVIEYEEILDNQLKLTR